MASVDFSRMYRSFEQHPNPITLEVTAGQVPKWLYGVFLRVGPGRYDFGKEFTVNHWFDGSALMHNFIFEDGQVTYRSKYLQSESLKKAVELHYNVFTEFGTKCHTDYCKSTITRFLSNFVIPELTDNNTLHVYQIQGRVYMATETHYIHKIDPLTLETEERIDLNKLVNVHMVTSQPLTDHDGVTYNVGTSFTNLKYQIIKFPPATNEDVVSDPLRSGSVLCQIPFRWKMRFGYNHSLAITDNYVIFHEQPLVMNGMKLIASQVRGYSFRDCMEWMPEEKNRFFIVDKVSGSVWKTHFTTAVARFAMNHINAYEEDGHIIIDVITYPNTDIIDKLYLNKLRKGQFESTSPPQAQRYILPSVKKIKEVKDRKGENLITIKNTKAEAKLFDGEIILKPENLGPPGFELPQINYAYTGKKYNYLYATGLIYEGAYKNSVIKLDVQTKESQMWTASKEMTFSEPVFVSHPNARAEDDGLVLAIGLSFNDQIADSLRIFDAKNMTEIARLDANGFPIPPLFHGRYFPFASDEYNVIEK